jgi:hypothetical protein
MENILPLPIIEPWLLSRQARRVYAIPGELNAIFLLQKKTNSGRNTKKSAWYVSFLHGRYLWSEHLSLLWALMTKTCGFTLGNKLHDFDLYCGVYATNKTGSRSDDWIY